jgi:hypothetical protein
MWQLNISHLVDRPSEITSQTIEVDFGYNFVEAPVFVISNKKNLCHIFVGMVEKFISKSTVVNITKT